MISPRAPLIGLPTFRLSSCDSSSVWSLMSAANLASVRPRLPAAQFAQPLRSSKAFWAAATARSTSSRPPSGAVAMTVPFAGFDDVEGLAVGRVDALAADDHAGDGGGRGLVEHGVLLGGHGVPRAGSGPAVSPDGMASDDTPELPEVAPVGVAPQAGHDTVELRAGDAHPLQRMPGELEGGLGFRIREAADLQRLEGLDLAAAAGS